METKRLIAVGIFGRSPETKLPQGALWISLGSREGAVLLGVGQRREDDIERALRWASKEMMSKRRMVVKEVSVDIGSEKIELNWERNFEKDFTLLSPGEVLVSPEVAKIYDRLFLFERVEEEGGELFFLRGQRSRPARLRGVKPKHASLVGRQAETKRFEELLEQVSVDQGQVLGILGEAGIGKTRLVLALKEVLSTRSIPFVEGVHATDSPIPYEGFREVVTGLVGEEVATLSRWEMTEIETDFLRLFLEPHEKIKRLADLSEDEIRQGLFSSVQKLIHAAARNPLVVILEDLHWAGGDSLDLLEFVMEGVESTKLLLVLVHRPELEPRWNKRLNYNEIRVSPFVAEEVDRFVGNIAGVDRVAAKVWKHLSKVSLGNPLFVEEIVRKLLDSGTLYVEKDERSQSVLRMLEGAEAEIPATIHALIASRFDRLGEQAKNALQWAGLLGVSFEDKEYRDLLAEQGMDPAAVVEEVTAKTYLREKSVYPKQILQFVHDLIYEVVLNSLPSGEKAQRHAVIGRFLEARYSKNLEFHADRIADHFLKSNDPQAAVPAALRAGNIEAERYQYPAALNYFKEAEKLWRDGNQTITTAYEIYAPLTRHLFGAGRLDDTRDALERWEAAGVGSSPEARGTFGRLQMNYYDSVAEFEKALEASKVAIEAFSEDSRFERERFDAIHDRIHALLGLSRSQEAHREALCALRELEDSPLRIPRLRIWARAAYCGVTAGDPRVALDYLEKARALSLDGDPPALRVELALRTAVTFDALGRHEEEITASTEAIDLCWEHGLRKELPNLFRKRSNAGIMSGRYELAFSGAKEGLRQAEMNHDKAEAAVLGILLLDGLLDVGVTAEAEKVWNELQSTIVFDKDPRQEARRYGIYAEMCDHKGDREKAAEFFSRAAEIYRKLDVQGWVSVSCFRALHAETRGHLRSVEELVETYNQLTRKPGVDAFGIARYQRWITLFGLLSQGADLDPGTYAKMDLLTCKYPFFRQKIFVAKIRWLDSIGKAEEARKLRDVYRKERERIAKNVPEPYKHDFFNHPLLRVPD